MLKRRIRKVAILGSGTMGGGIAAQLANAGIRSYLLDIVPRELTDKEKAQGLTLESPSVRNRIAANSKAILINSKPASFMDKTDSDLVTVGNTEDNMDWLAECDWVVEVVPENIDIKKAVLKNIAVHIKPGTFVTSNTSSISINKIAEDMPLEFRQYWMGTHFFNPVRHMKLLELIPCKDTLPEVLSFFADFGERVLGKGVVYANDTPAFIANRLGNWAGPSCCQLMIELGLSIAEADALTGSVVGRPGTGTFGLFDMVGVDIAVLSTAEVCHNVSDPQEKAMYTLPPFCQRMLDHGLLGAKTKGGFYKKVGKEKQVIDVNTFEYGPVQPVQFASLEAARKEKTLGKKLEAFFEADDKAAQFVWRNISGLFLYAASKIPEVSNNVLNMDRALRWGYNHVKGPFELFSELDLPKYIARMEAEGMKVPAWIKEMLAAGITSFYTTKDGVDMYYSNPHKKFVPIAHQPEVIILKELKFQNKVIKSSDAGTLYDIGDGVICLECHSKATAISPELLSIISVAQEELSRNWEGMVITGSGKNFCVGANIGFILERVTHKNWDAIDKALLQGHTVYDNNKYSLKPVVMAIKGQCLGGGCELLTQSSAIQASGESYIGQVEIGVGLIPAGGGIKEAVMRVNQQIAGTKAAPVDFVAPYFENIIMAKVSTSAKEAIKLGYLRPTDGISLNDDFLIADAKKRVLGILEAGYCAPVRRPFPAFGQNALALLKMGTRGMYASGAMSEHDWHIACKIIDVFAGGSVVSGGMITEDYLEALEREVFLSLCGEQKTQDRIAHMLKTGKPLRN